MANHHTNAACLDSEGLTRRNLLMGAPLVALGSALVARPAIASAVMPGQVIEKPFLHVLDGPIAATHYSLKAGDMVLVLPGTGPWDDMHLLRDGRFAAVQVFNPGGKEVGINVYGSDDHFYVPKERADEVIAGRVVKRIRLDRGRWID
ncbi:hypothetical protein [Pseudogemmobacter sonorensis]|uniref:hypothetical protein n=1 Tax=Pseudogemmobacter sonorensis TaxID=2989681 RepID=UPI0036D0E617